MEDTKITKMPITDSPEFARVAELIRPLPDEIGPSVEFLRRMRSDLLKLRGVERGSARQAA